MNDPFDLTNMHPCPRCTRGCTTPLCYSCTTDQVAEADAGVVIAPDLWPIEGLAEFTRAAEQATL